MVEIVFSCFPVIPQQESTFNTSAAFKKILLKTHLTSETRRCVYLELLLKFNIQSNKKVALECCVHKHQQEPKKGVFTDISQPKERSLGGLSALKKKKKDKSVYQGERQNNTTKLTFSL